MRAFHLLLVALLTLNGFASDSRPDQDINTADVYRDSDGTWHINSTYYRPIRVIYSVTDTSDLESGAPKKTIHTVILQQKENASTAVSARNWSLSVGIVKIEFPSKEELEKDASTLNHPPDSSPDTSAQPVPSKSVPQLNKVLSLKRSQTSNQSAFGSAYVDGKFICYFMEVPGNQGLLSKSTFDATFQLTGTGAVLKSADTEERLSFTSKLVRDGDGNFNAIDSDSIQEATQKLMNALALSPDSPAVGLQTEITSLPGPGAFEQ